MENEFKIEIGIDYKKEDIETLRNNLNQIQDNFKDIKITLNTTQIDNANKTLKKIKKNLKEINDSKVNLNINTNYKDVVKTGSTTSSSSSSKINTTKSASKNTTTLKNDIKSVYKELNSLERKLNSSEFNLRNLNTDGAVKDFKTLNRQIVKSQSECKNLMNTLGKNPTNTGLNSVIKSMKKISSESDLINSNIENSKNKIFNNIASRINSGNIDSTFEKYKLNRDNLSDTNNVKLKRQVSDDISNAEKKYSDLQTAVSNKDTEKAISLHRELNVELAKVDSSYKIAKNSQSSFQKTNNLETKRINALREIRQMIDSNSVASKRYEIALDAVYNKLKKCDSSDIQLGLNQWKKLKTEIKTSGATVESFITRLKYQFQKLSTYITATFVIDKVQQSLRTMYSNVVEIDKAMTELYRVTSLTPEQYTKLYSNMIGTTKEYGATLKDIIDSTANWSKLGFDATTANKLAGITTMYQNITDVD